MAGSRGQAFGARAAMVPPPAKPRLARGHGGGGHRQCGAWQAASSQSRNARMAALSARDFKRVSQ